MKIGYARVSTADQNLDLQFNALTEYGCTKIYQEKISGKNTDRQELKKLLKDLRKGDQVVVWKLDRVGRSLRDLVDMVALFHEQEVNFVSLHDHIDTTTATGRFTFNIFASLFVNIQKPALMPREQEEEREGDQKAYRRKICN
jgi:DNA invertase Pin-like site-specific DNA recombinase